MLINRFAKLKWDKSSNFSTTGTLGRTHLEVVFTCPYSGEGVIVPPRRPLAGPVELPETAADILAQRILTALFGLSVSFQVLTDLIMFEEQKETLIYAACPASWITYLV